MWPDEAACSHMAAAKTPAWVSGLLFKLFRKAWRYYPCPTVEARTGVPGQHCQTLPHHPQVLSLKALMYPLHCTDH